MPKSAPGLAVSALTAAPNTTHVLLAPHSWPLAKWPAHVYPGNKTRGGYLFNRNREEMVAKGVVVRVGIDLVFLGAAYTEWLQSQGKRVDGFALDRYKRMWPSNGRWPQTDLSDLPANSAQYPYMSGSHA